MRPDIDANLSPMVTALLRDAGNYASHVADHGLLSAADEAIFEWADRNAAVVLTADSGFAMMLPTSVVSAWETHAASLWRTGRVCQLSCRTEPGNSSAHRASRSCRSADLGRDLEQRQMMYGCRSRVLQAQVLDFYKSKGPSQDKSRFVVWVDGDDRVWVA